MRHLTDCNLQIYDNVTKAAFPCWQGKTRQEQAEQQEASAARLARQKQRLTRALDEYIEEPEAPAEIQTFDAILQNYRSLLDTSVSGSCSCIWMHLKPIAL